MKALSLRQPWAWAVVHAGKSIENRRWNTKFRGEFLIHAAKGLTLSEYGESIRWIRDVLAEAPDGALIELPRFGALERGGIVGRARLVSVEPPLSPLEDLTGSRPYPVGHNGEWHMAEQFGFVLEDIRPLPFVPLKGALGFFDVDARLLGGAT